MKSYIGPDGRKRYRAFAGGSSNAQFHYDEDGNPVPIDPKTGHPVSRSDPMANTGPHVCARFANSG